VIALTSAIKIKIRKKLLAGIAIRDKLVEGNLPHHAIINQSLRAISLRHSFAYRNAKPQCIQKLNQTADFSTSSF
jgi:hypothetical protein